MTIEMEIIGLVTTTLAIAGCWFNNRRRRICFVVWGVSNLLSLGLHLDAAIWSLALRDAAFVVLAVEGWVRWQR